MHNVVYCGLVECPLFSCEPSYRVPWHLSTREPCIQDLLGVAWGLVKFQGWGHVQLECAAGLVWLGISDPGFRLMELVKKWLGVGAHGLIEFKSCTCKSIHRNVMIY